MKLLYVFFSKLRRSVICGVSDCKSPLQRGEERETMGEEKEEERKGKGKEDDEESIYKRQWEKMMDVQQ